MKYLKNFESIFRVTADELIRQVDCYQCQNCGSLIELFRPKTIKCKYCFSTDLKFIDTKNKDSSETYNQ